MSDECNRGNTVREVEFNCEPVAIAALRFKNAKFAHTRAIWIIHKLEISLESHGTRYRHGDLRLRMRRRQQRFLFRIA